MVHNAMREIVERLARRLAAMEGWTWDDLHEQEDTSFGWGRNHCRQVAYDLIRTMEQPTISMIMAGHEFCRRKPEYSMDSADRCWRAMAAAALNT